jgi:hypothetical protein
MAQTARHGLAGTLVESGHSPAHDRKCPTVANRLISTPISAMITCAAVALTRDSHQVLARCLKGSNGILLYRQ